MNKKCPECGKEMNENINICPNCGFKIKDNNDNQKKKRLPVWAIILIVLGCLLPLIIVLIIIISILKVNTKVNVNTSNWGNYPIVLEGRTGYTGITYEEYEEKIDNKEHFVVVIVNDGCKYCQMYKSVVEEVTENNKLPIYYINLANLTNNEYTKLSTSNYYLMENNWGTPTTLYMHGSDVIDAISGYVEETVLEDFLDNYFIMR